MALQLCLVCEHAFLCLLAIRLMRIRLSVAHANWLHTYKSDPNPLLDFVDVLKLGLTKSNFDNVGVIGANGERIDERLLERRFAALDEAYFQRLPKRAERLVREKAPFESVSTALRKCGWNETTPLVSMSLCLRMLKTLLAGQCIVGLLF